MKQTSRRIHWRNDWRKAGLLAGLALALVLGLAACYPGGPEDLGDIGVVVTIKDPQANFSGLMTYAMEDTVVALVDPDDDSSHTHRPQVQCRYPGGNPYPDGQCGIYRNR